jgi:unspecific monooxygenase
MSRSSTSTGSETSLDLPPGPDLSGWQLAQLWIERPVEFFEGCAARYGDTFRIELGSLGTTVLFSHPDAVRQIFQLSPDSYQCRPFNDYYQSVMGTHSLFLSDGSSHRRKRRVQMPLLNRRVVDQHGEAIRSLARETIAAWPTGLPFSPRPTLHLLSLKIILGVIFGSREDELGRQIAGVFEQEIYQDLGSWSVWTRFSHLHPRFRELIGAEIRRRRSALDPGRYSLFDALLQARDEAGDLTSEEEIQDHIFTMLVAGVDPTALAVSWVLYQIHEEPEVLARLRNELAEVGSERDAHVVSALPYLAATCQETIRLHPIPSTPSGRKLVVPVDIGGRRYEAGVTLLPCTYLLHRRPDLYPEPSLFRPERFLERQYAAHEYFPFGGGARTCIGGSLAPLELKLVLAEILTRCRLVPAHDGKVVPVRHGTLLAPSDAMKFHLVGWPDSPRGDAP